MSRMMGNCQVRFLGEEETATCASLPAIDQDALLHKLNTFPTMRRLIKSWLKAGVALLDASNGNTPMPQKLSRLSQLERP